jgi:nitroimidazol reductase NimA-like FMN-containing flavoprotein (pyridoxamine 5'-phosphate oxidase superfamily)
MTEHAHTLIPVASRPHMPGYGIAEATAGGGLLPWNWAVERLSAGRNYWLSTTRPDGHPHVMPIWGVWIENQFYFSTGAQSRKARNLAVNPHCVISIEIADGSVMVEGRAEIASLESVPPSAFTTYQIKYDWELDPKMGPIFALRPSLIFGFSNVPGEFAESATRWRFSAR